MESWSGVIEWSLGGKCWSGSVGLKSNKASPYFITKQDTLGVGVNLSIIIWIYF